MNKTIKHRSYAKNYASLANDTKAIEALLNDIFLSRGAEYGKQNDYSLANLIRPENFLGLDQAVSLLFEALQNQKRLLIVGDFDADGATSTVVAMRCLSAFGFQYVDYLVPNRFVFGYGLTPEIVEAATEKNPDVIITVDNGISSIEGVQAAKDRCIQVLVTDHHLPGNETPNADAIVNPNQHGCEFPSKNLAGVGVIFYVMSALRKKLREENWFEQNHIQEPNLADVLDLVALGTVADVVPLDYNNRILVAAGLQRIRAGKACAGITALLSVASKEAHRISATDIGFTLGPRLNAAGRLDDMSLGIQCLLSDGATEAYAYARELDDLNRDRKSIEGAMQAEALKQFESFSDADMENKSGICLYQADWHQGVIGILASRIKDKMHRPTIVFANTDNGELKGSGRSIPGVHLRDVLDEVATQTPGLIEKFGGHAMAAGLSLNPGKLDEFSAAFNAIVQQHLTEESKEPIILSDGELPEELLTLPLAHSLKNNGPWGQHFPEPTFHGTFQIVNQRIVGQKHLKLVLSRETYSNQVFDAIAFNVDLNKWPNADATEVQVAYHLDVNVFRGNESLQLMVVDLAG